MPGESNTTKSLQKDTAYALAMAIAHIVSPLLSTHTVRLDALGMFYRAALGALEAYEEHADRNRQTPQPSRN